jgi:hypothetical protein
MATCPRDGTPLADDYGMTTCPKCGVVIFVDMDGEAQVGSVTPAHDPSADALAMLEPAAEDPNASADPFALGYQETEAAEAQISVPEPESEPIPHSELEPEPESAPGLEPGPEPGPEPELNMDSLLGYGEPVSSEDMSPIDLAMSDSGPGRDRDSNSGRDASDPLGISEYANSELSQAKDGPLLFRLVISGIDSKEIRASLREAMEDSRFGWDVDAVMRSIVKGELRIDHVSPVKATIMISRIKCMPVRIRWEQYAVTQADSF